jgi:methyl-accepting chemotaxis protein
MGDSVHRRRLGLRAKLNLTVIVAACSVVALTAFWLTMQHSLILAERQEKAKHLVEIPYSLIARYQRLEAEGKLSRQEAQRSALEAVKTLRYDESNYFWINDLRPTMVMHPVKSELDGQDLSGYKDPNGKALFTEMTAVVRNHGGGFVNYMWPKPGSTKPVPKLSYVKGFDNWGWVIGTGIYIDDVYALWWANARIAAVIGLTGLIVLFAVSTIISRSILGQLGGDPAQAAYVAKAIADGELTVAVTAVAGGDDSLLASMKRMRDELRTSIAQITNGVEQLASVTTEISGSARQMAQGADSQQSQTAQIAAAVQQMSSSVAEVSANSNHAAENARQAAGTARDGGHAVEDTVARMRRLTDSVAKIGRQIAELGKRSDQVGRIVSVIEEIAEQTNLLSLNAAIEAARAGEQGRGFAVVADEVRKLADRTTTATKEIAEMITAIQQDTQAAVAAMEEGTAQVREAVAAATTAGERLQQIIDGAEKGADMITQIATAATQQSRTTEEINSSINEIAKISQGFASGAEQSAKGCEGLSNLALNLQSLVAKFKLDDQSYDPREPAMHFPSGPPHPGPAAPGCFRAGSVV